MQAPDSTLHAPVFSQHMVQACISDIKHVHICTTHSDTGTAGSSTVHSQAQLWRLCMHACLSVSSPLLVWWELDCASWELDCTDLLNLHAGPGLY